MDKLKSIFEKDSARITLLVIALGCFGFSKYLEMNESRGIFTNCLRLFFYLTIALSNTFTKESTYSKFQKYISYFFYFMAFLLALEIIRSTYFG